MFDFIKSNSSEIIAVLTIAAPAIITIYKQIRAKKKAVDVIRTLVDSTDRILAELDEPKVHAIKHDLQVAHAMKGTEKIVKKELDYVRDSRRRNNNLELGVDVDKDMNYRAGAKWKINF